MKTLLDNYQDGIGYEILCPKCKSNYLRHNLVEIFERKEDEEHGLHISVSKQNISIDDNLEGNPSLRRNGIAIHFWCEECPTTSTLTIAQHKGNTHINININQ